jgi:hypothetical protein
MKTLVLIPAVAMQLIGVACGGWFFYAAWVGIPAYLFNRAATIGVAGVVLFAVGSGVEDAVS